MTWHNFIFTCSGMGRLKKTVKKIKMAKAMNKIRIIKFATK